MVECLAMEFRVWGCGLRVEGFGFRDSGIGFGVWGAGIRDAGLGFRVLGFGFRVDVSLGFRLQSAEFSGVLESGTWFHS